MEVTAEDTDDAEDTDEEGLPWQAVRWIAVPIAGFPSKPLLLRVFRVLRVLRGNSYRCFQVNLR